MIDAAKVIADGFDKIAEPARCLRAAVQAIDAKQPRPVADRGPMRALAASYRRDSFSVFQRSFPRRPKCSLMLPYGCPNKSTAMRVTQIYMITYIVCISEHGVNNPVAPCRGLGGGRVKGAMLAWRAARRKK
jgi:hypothetical protein